MAQTLKQFIDQYQASTGRRILVWLNRIVDPSFYRAAAAAGLLTPYDRDSGHGKTTIDGVDYTTVNTNGELSGQTSKLGEATATGAKIGMAVTGGYIGANALGGGGAPLDYGANLTEAAAAPAGATAGGAAAGGTAAGGAAAGGTTAGSAATNGAVTAGSVLGSKTLWSWLGPTLIGAGLNVAGGVMGANAAKDAAAIQAAATEKALALQKEMFDAEQAKDQERFDIHRADLAPYRAIGAGATGRLGNLWGFDPTPPGVTQAQSDIGSVIGKVMQPTATQTAQTAPPSASAAVGAAMGTGPQVGDVRTINGQQGRWDGHGWEAI